MLEGYTTSFTLRVLQLITSQMDRLKSAFDKARSELDYPGRFLAVYPVKVNQRRDCVTTVVGSDPAYGLEAGTKAELLLIKRVIGDAKQRRIICNGAKDPEYLDMIHEMQKDGFHMAISVESVHEAKLIAESFGPVKTELVLRLKPYISVEGHWSHSSGRDSKFGLSIHDLFRVVELFKSSGFEGCITTILAHAGSQIEDVTSFGRLGEYMTRVYVELLDMGLPNLKIIDFGGGLAIDYDSSNREDYMEEYARQLIQGIQRGLSVESSQREAPDILVESGRGITALGSMIVVEALEVRSVFPEPEEYTSEQLRTARKEWLSRISKTGNVKDLVALWNEFHSIYTVPGTDLRRTLENEMMVGELESAVRRHIAGSLVPKGETEFGSNDVLRSFWYPEHIVVGNFSVFNAIGDYVLVDQHFPIIPHASLDVRPETTVRLVDITCDSDGEFSQFHRPRTERIWFTKDNRPMTMTKSEKGKGVPIGSFSNLHGSFFVIALTGAYQDVIEMNHNLLGDLPDIEVSVSEEGEWSITWVEGAERMDQILEEVGYKDMDAKDDPYMSGRR
jgi:arginine decarboxylase